MKNIHGANLFEISRKNNVEIDKIMDFSSNINPLSPSPKAFEFLKKNLSLIKTYPDPLYKNLKEAISKYSSCATVSPLFYDTTNKKSINTLKEILG